MSFTFFRAARSCCRAIRAWRCNSKKMATTPSSTKPREGFMGKVVSLDNLLASMEARRSEAAPWLSPLLGEAGEKFAHSGLPNRRVEAWRYSDLAKALHETVVLDIQADAPPELTGACVAAFEDGVLNNSLSSYCAMGAQ